MDKPTLLLTYETEVACRQRLLDDGFADRNAFEISSYLAQSTDLALEFDALATACNQRGISFLPVELDRLAETLPKLDRAATLVWTLTDGIAYFRGSVAPALARLAGFRTIGSDDALFALCQDKFRAGAVLRGLGLPCPAAGLARNGAWIVEPPPSASGWFVKPNRLGAKIGIWPQSHCHDKDDALELSRRVFTAYRDDVIVQAYVPGRNVRASFLDMAQNAGPETLGIFLVESGGDFQTMEDSLALYGETGATAKASGEYTEPFLQPLAAIQPAATEKIREIALTMMAGLGLRDVFSIDLRVEPNDSVHLIEFEVCPGLPCFDFRAYCLSQFGLSLADAMAESAARRLQRS